MGRWTSKEPLGFASGMTNFYEYAYSDPMSYVDTDGLAPRVALQTETGVGGGTASPTTGGTISTTGGGISSPTVYVAPNGQAVLAPRGSIVQTANNGSGLRITPPGSQFGGGTIRLMEPNRMSPNGYGTMQNSGGQYLNNLGQVVPSNSPAAHIQPTFKTCPGGQ